MNKILINIFIIYPIYTSERIEQIFRYGGVKAIRNLSSENNFKLGEKDSTRHLLALHVADSRLNLLHSILFPLSHQESLMSTEMESASDHQQIMSEATHL